MSGKLTSQCKRVKGGQLGHANITSTIDVRLPFSVVEPRMVSSLNVLGYAILLRLVCFTDTSVSFYHLVNINCQVKDIANGIRLVKSLLRMSYQNSTQQKPLIKRVRST